MDDHNTDFCEELLPWSDSLPEECRNKNSRRKRRNLIKKVLAIERLL